MSLVQKLRILVRQRLNAAIEEILAAFEKTIVKYEQEAALRQEVISRQHALLCAVHMPLMGVPSADAFTQQLMGSKDPVNPNDQCQNQNHTQQDPKGSHVKEEQQGDPLPDLDEAEIIQFTYNPRLAVRPSEVIYRSQSEPGSAGPDQDIQLVLSSETEDSDDYGKDSVKPKSVSNHSKSKTTRKQGPFKCRVCSQTFKAHRFLVKHIKAHLLEPDQVCGLCGERFQTSDSLRLHIQTHQTGIQSRDASFCQHSNTDTSPRFHKDENPTCCDDCEKTFPQVWNKRKKRCWPQRKHLYPEILEGPKKKK
ncbi:hypothetical protein Q5P01_018896 [Channa striata]|uniref:C2H2-type domain-containing protein n=1 Tax=Channa striata TaxID=64152 RepID=A0AA88M590_CHASR|nr:hypothetical protein Q5P01_018896 [Channa striata]